MLAARMGSILRVKYILNRAAKQCGDPEGEREARIVSSGLDCIDGLARDAQLFCEVRLRQFLTCAQNAEIVLHWYRRETK